MKAIFFAAAKPVGFIAAIVFLSGCENPYLQQFKEEFGWTEARMVSDGWLKGRRIAADLPYCYRTLGDIDCYREPKPGQEPRLVNELDEAGQ